MATWVYNSGAALPLLAMKPYNNVAGAGMTGAATSGNTLRVTKGSLRMASVSMHAPGSNATAERNTGRLPRTVTWDWHVVATNEANLNAIEAAIEAYIADGGTYTLSDGTSSNDTAKIDGDQTTRVGNRTRLADNRYLQTWRIVFKVLQPNAGGL